MVPAIRVLMWVFLSSYNFANPKSDILGQRYSSSKILLALTSRCTILGLDSSWRYANALAVAKHILKRVGQSRCKSLFPTKSQKLTMSQTFKHQNQATKNSLKSLENEIIINLLTWIHTFTWTYEVILGSVQWRLLFSPHSNNKMRKILNFCFCFVFFLSFSIFRIFLDYHQSQIESVKFETFSRRKNFFSKSS